MKKIILPAAVIAMIFASCSNQGAFSQREKDSLDTVDTSGREDKFKALETPDSTGNSSEEKKEDKNKPATNAPTSQKVPVPSNGPEGVPLSGKH